MVAPEEVTSRWTAVSGNRVVVTAATAGLENFKAQRHGNFAAPRKRTYSWHAWLASWRFKVLHILDTSWSTIGRRSVTALFSSVTQPVPHVPVVCHNIGENN